jgi:hypothetical protein
LEASLELLKHRLYMMRRLIEDLVESISLTKVKN